MSARLSDGRSWQKLVERNGTQSTIRWTSPIITAFTRARKDESESITVKLFATNNFRRDKDMRLQPSADIIERLDIIAFHVEADRLCGWE